MPFDSIPISFAGLRLATMTIRADESGRLVGFGDARDDGPLLGAGIDAKLHQLFRLRHPFGRQDLRHTQFDAHELID